MICLPEQQRFNYGGLCVFWKSRNRAFCNSSITVSHFTFAPIVEWAACTSMSSKSCSMDESNWVSKILHWFQCGVLDVSGLSLRIYALYSPSGQYLHTALIALPSSHSTSKSDKNNHFLYVANLKPHKYTAPQFFFFVFISFLMENDPPPHLKTWKKKIDYCDIIQTTLEMNLIFCHKQMPCVNWNRLIL